MKTLPERLFAAAVFGVLALIFGSTTFLQGDGKVSADTSAQGCSCDEGKEAAHVVKICPVMKMSTHDGFCDYYALRCDTDTVTQTTTTQPVLWQGPCEGQLTTGCQATNCQPTKWKRDVADEGHHIHANTGKNGLTNNPNWNKNALKDIENELGPKAKVEWFQMHCVKYKNKKGDDIFAQVYLLLIRPKDPTSPPTLMAFGHQIQDPGTAKPVDFEITQEAAVAKMKGPDQKDCKRCHVVTVGAVSFQVVTGTDDP